MSLPLLANRTRCTQCIDDLLHTSPMRFRHGQNILVGLGRCAVVDLDAADIYRVVLDDALMVNLISFFSSLTVVRSPFREMVKSLMTI